MNEFRLITPCNALPFITDERGVLIATMPRIGLNHEYRLIAAAPALLAAAKVGLHAVDGLIGMLAAAGEKDETLDTAKRLIEAAIAAARSTAADVR